MKDKRDIPWEKADFAKAHAVQLMAAGEGFGEKDVEKLSEALGKKGKHEIGEAEVQDNLTISQVGRFLGVNQGTVRSFVENHSLGKKRDVGRKKAVLVLSRKDIEQIQEHYGRKSQSPKETLADLVSKSQFLVYVPGVKQLSGFSDVEKIKEFVQNSLLTGQIIVYRKVPAKIEVKLELENLE